VYRHSWSPGQAHCVLPMRSAIGVLEKDHPGSSIAYDRYCAIQWSVARCR
jgi:hypothetical protein